MQVFIGNNITQAADPLIPINLNDLIARIANPKPQLLQFIIQLRAVKTIDTQQYRKLKTRLPYFTCGRFHPLIRKKENFTSIETFVVDLDHLTSQQQNPEALRNKIISDTRVAALFTSPGADGLKIIFRLHKPCKDSALFTAFYKLFVANLGKKFDLSGVIDLHTCDVTRACFLSYDPQAFFRPSPEPVQITDYLPPDDFSQSEIQIKKAEKELKQLSTQQHNQTNLTDDILLQIKQKLNPSFKPRKNKQYYLPPEIDGLLPLITNKLKEYEIEITHTEPINYGRKIRVKAAIFWAEVNIFYGKRGFSVVKTPKTGSNPKLADITYQIIAELFQNTTH